MTRRTGLLPVAALLCLAGLLMLPPGGADAAVRRATTLTLRAPDTAQSGVPFTVSGRLRPRAGGRLVLLQRRTPTGWHTVERVRTGARSRYRVALVRNRVGVAAYRARVAGTRRTRPGVSPMRRVEATQAAPSSGWASPPTWTPCGADPPPKADGEPWRCTFDDEFDARTGDATALDREKWNAEVSTGNNFYTGDPATGQVCYVDQPNTISVSGGALHLSVVKTGKPTPCGAYTTAYQGGMVHTFGKFAQAYGRYQVRAKLPANRTAGVQETLWLYPVTPKYGPWPGSGEIDLAEFYSQYPTLDVPYLHYRYDPLTANPVTNTNEVTSYSCVIDPAQWNTYTLDWQPGTLTVSYNGNTCLVDHYQASNSTDPAAPFNQPFYLLLTQAVGMGTNAPNSLTTFPATLDIDYVRVWK